MPTKDEILAILNDSVCPDCDEFYAANGEIDPDDVKVVKYDNGDQYACFHCPICGTEQTIRVVE